MIINPKNGMTDVVDRGAKGGPYTYAVAPINAIDAMRRGGVLKDNKPRFVFAEDWDGSDGSVAQAPVQQ